MTTSLAPLTEEDCFDLLAAHHVGHIGVTVAALPVILPVNYVLDGRNIVIRTDPGPTLQAAINHQVVCLEIDDVDPVLHQGWSVVATGVFSEITEAARLAGVGSLPLKPWGRSVADHWVELPIVLVSGRTVTHAAGRGPKVPSGGAFRPFQPSGLSTTVGP